MPRYFIYVSSNDLEDTLDQVQELYGQGWYALGAITYVRGLWIQGMEKVTEPPKPSLFAQIFKGKTDA